jgi:hypothetical protein
MEKNGLGKASSSKVYLEKRDGQQFVVKELSAEEAENELFFYTELKKAGIPSLDTSIEDEKLFVEFIENAKTLRTRRIWRDLSNSARYSAEFTPFNSTAPS